LRKIKLGPWVRHAFKLLSHLKKVRGTPLDIFGYTHERVLERRLIHAYEALCTQILTTAPQEITADLYTHWVHLLSLPEQIRGFGHVKKENLGAGIKALQHG
jgi:indolepyruvate ferredoxin oxidoreductase